MIWRLLASMSARQAAKRCRSCAKPIFGDDGFGRSEEICAACRA
jgi:hypothetical protein